MALFNTAIDVKKMSKLSLVALAGLTLCAAAQAGPYKTFGSHFAWVNNFDNSTIGSTFGSGTTANMSFSWNYPNTSKLYGYPAIVRGWHYGWNPTGDTLFPKQISKITSAPCYFSYSSGGTNMAGDFAYDLFLRWDSAKSKPQAEVMIWAGHNSWPIGSKSGTNVLTHNGVSYDLWEGNNSAAGYYVYTFVPTNTVGVSKTLPTSGRANLDLKVFFNYLGAHRSGSHYSNNMYLDVVEAGLEITKGSGWAWVQGAFSG
jgi:hypothetical protein